MIEVNPSLYFLKRRVQRLLGSAIEAQWIRGCELDPILGEREWLEQTILEMALRARAAMPHGGRLVIESCNLDLDECSASAECLTAGRYVMFEMTCLRQLPGSDADDIRYPLEIDITDDLWLASQARQCLDVLHAIGGNLTEYNEPGRALTLRAFLPSAATVVYSDERESLVSQSVPGQKILLVEDEGFVREVATEILETAGYSVITAKTGKEALEVFQEHGPFELLVTDVVMPGMNGHELAQELEGLQPGLKTIYMSGYPDNAIVRESFGSPGTVYVQKPFTLESFTSKVEQILGPAALRD